MEGERMKKETIKCQECNGTGTIKIATGTTLSPNIKEEDCDVCHGLGYIELFAGLPKT
jgi:DnaJ-class molecular chaperone